MVLFCKIFGLMKKKASKILKFIQESRDFMRPKIGREEGYFLPEPD
jgi:hypothetical protein